MDRYKRLSIILALLLMTSVASVAAPGPGPGGAPAPQAVLGSAFTYQGQLRNKGGLVNSTCDFQFSLFDAATGGKQIGATQTKNGVLVTNGLFSVVLDFGATAFTGDQRYLQISVKLADETNFTTLSPRQALLAAPYALSLRPGATISSSDASAVLAAGGLFGPVGVIGASTKGVGIWGGSQTNAGVLGTSQNGDGVLGQASNYGSGVHGKNTGNGTGVYGEAAGTGSAIYGKNTGSGTGVLGLSANGIGVAGESDNPSATGVYGRSSNGIGVRGYSETDVGVHGEAYKGTGVLGESWHVINGIGGVGVQAIGVGGQGVYAEGFEGVLALGHVGVNGYNNDGSPQGIGVWGHSFKGYAGYFSAKVHVGGPLDKPAGSFKIDHPLDPANKYLYHSFVESPDMKNIYDGVVTLDGGGAAVVQLPDWFEALNQEFRYQLTAIGAPAPGLYVAEKIRGNHFKIAGGAPGMEVSWQVTGVRHDAYANAHRIPVEEDKPQQERGKYLYPKEAGQPETQGVDYERRQRLERQVPDRATLQSPVEGGR